MTRSFRFVGAAALGAALLLTACTKKTDQTTTTSTDTQSATTAPASAAGATGVPDTTAAPAAAATTEVKVDAKSGNGSGGLIEMPVYPGATASKGQALSMSTENGSVAVKIYTTGDDTKKVTDWYKSHLPASWKNMVVGSDKATMGTFVNETGDGDQTVFVTPQDDHTTRIQLTTKHGK